MEAAHCLKMPLLHFCQASILHPFSNVSLHFVKYPSPFVKSPSHLINCPYLSNVCPICQMFVCFVKWNFAAKYSLLGSLLHHFSLFLLICLLKHSQSKLLVSDDSPHSWLTKPNQIFAECSGKLSAWGCISSGE